MKTLMKLLLMLAVVVVVSGCDDDDLILSDGLTREIHELVPPEILEVIEGLGMPVYGGGKPPNIEEIFEGAPLILLSTNVPNDHSPGYRFADLRVKFYNQDNSKFTIGVDYTSGSERGTGLGGFVVGDNNRFTVFAELDSSIGDSHADMVLMFSGERVADGILELHMANFMVDNYGNPQGYWIPDGTGRVFHDSDGHSGIVSSLKVVRLDGDVLTISAQ